MTKILGLDLGTTSIGWALMEKGERLIDGGVIIFPRGNNLDGKSGKEASFSQQRTSYRGMRRRLFRRKLRRDRLLKFFKEWWNISDKDIHKDTRPEELYRIRAEALNPETEVSLPELCRIFLYFSKKRGFKSNRKSAAKEGEDLGVVKEGIHNLEQTILQGGYKTLGQYFYSIILSHKQGDKLNERILGRWTSRKMYMDEFDAIVQVQSHKHQTLSADKVNIIRKEIFYQRPLRSAKHLVSNCSYEPRKKVMPRSHPVFQEFRLRQMLLNLTWVNKDTGEFGTLTPEQIELAYQLFTTKLKPTDAQLKSVLGLSKRSEFNDVTVKSTTTLIHMREALGDVKFYSLSTENLLNIYHSLLYSMDDNYPGFIEYMERKFGIQSDTGKKLWEIVLEPDYSNISHKAAQKMLPHLREGKPYEEAAVLAGYHHSVRNTFQNLDRIPQLKTNEMRNPVVQKAVSQCINLVNKVIEVYGRPDEVVVELARELKKPKEAREKERLKNRNIEKRREEYASVLSRHRGASVPTWDSLITKYELWLELGAEEEDLRGFDGFAAKIKPADMQKYQLWLEAGRISPYTGKVISLTQLFSPEIEIEHIVPYSKSLDNSMLNKTLCERHFNHDKTNRTPLEFFESRPKHELDSFVTRLGYIQNKIKRDQFLKKGTEAEYLNSQLSDTATIARRVVEKLNVALPSVRTSKGRLTALLRNQWGLNNLLYGDPALDHETITTIKNRGDHRHHFIDACVLTAITPSIVQQVARAELGNYGKLGGIEIDQPFEGFRSAIYDKVNAILVVHRMRKRLVNKCVNPYRQSKSEIHKVQELKSVRGSLHEDTLYGKISFSNGDEKFVTRKDVHSLNEKQLEDIVDEGIKRHLRELISMTPGGWSAVSKHPILFNDRPLRRVRWMASDSNMPLLRRDTQTYATPGNNLLMAVYENETGKRDYLTLSFYEGVQRQHRREKLYPEKVGDKQLLFEIKPYDKFLWCEHPDEIDFNNPDDIQSRLYHVIKFTGSSIYLGQSIVANIKADYDNKPIKIKSSFNTLKGIKIKLDALGRIVWRSDGGPIQA